MPLSPPRQQLLLYSQHENGIVLMLQEALGMGPQEGDTERTRRNVSGGGRVGGGRPPKVAGGWLGAGVGFIELVVCYTEGMVAWFLISSLLRQVALASWPIPQESVCALQSGLLESVICALRRDTLLIIANLGAVLCTALALSVRYSEHFAMSWASVLARIAPPKGAQLSRIVLATFTIMTIGFVFQLWGQWATGRALFSAANYLKHGGTKGSESEGDVSALRALDLVLMAPMREEILFRYFGLHIVRNRVDGPRSVVICGLFFGLVHLSNASGARFAVSYVMLQVFLAALIGSFLCSRTLLQGHVSSLAEPLGLHVLNNLFSSLLPSSQELDLRDWFISFSILQTVAVFSVLLYWDVKELSKRSLTYQTVAVFSVLSYWDVRELSKRRTLVNELVVCSGQGPYLREPAVQTFVLGHLPQYKCKYCCSRR